MKTFFLDFASIVRSCGVKVAICRLASVFACGLIVQCVFAAPVETRNAVGFVEVNVPAQGINLVATPFLNLDGSEQRVGDIFGQQAPDGARVYIWDAELGDYFAIRYQADVDEWVDDGLNPRSDMVIGRGRAVWFENPTAEAVRLIVAGEVPGSDHEEDEVRIDRGHSLVGFAYPVEIDLDEAGVNLSPVDGDVIYRWNGEAYESISYVSWAGGWVDDELQPVSAISVPGTGFWYQAGAARTWRQSRPYEWR